MKETNATINTPGEGTRGTASKGADLRPPEPSAMRSS